MTAKDTVTACHAARFIEAPERPRVSDRNNGMVPTGSMITNSVTNTSVSSVTSTIPDTRPQYSLPGSTTGHRRRAPAGLGRRFVGELDETFELGLGGGVAAELVVCL